MLLTYTTCTLARVRGFESSRSPGVFFILHSEKTSFFCFNDDMAVVCDYCIPWKLFSPFHMFSRTVSFKAAYSVTMNIFPKILFSF